jgi:hypothetical protein
MKCTEYRNSELSVKWVTGPNDKRWRSKHLKLLSYQ